MSEEQKDNKLTMNDENEFEIVEKIMEEIKNGTYKPKMTDEEAEEFIKMLNKNSTQK